MKGFASYCRAGEIYGASYFMRVYQHGDDLVRFTVETTIYRPRGTELARDTRDVTVMPGVRKPYFVACRKALAELRQEFKPKVKQNE